MNDLTTTGMICGQITGLYGDVLQGWALNPAKPDMRLVVEIYIDGSSVAFAKASEFHPNVAASDDFNGFAVQLRESWLAGARTISARVANQENWLDGTIQLPTPSPAEPSSAVSQVWYTGGLTIKGWAVDITDPHRAVVITMREGTSILSKTIANRAHHELTYLADAKHAFEIDLPWKLADGKKHTLHLEADRGTELNGSPITVCCWPEGLEAMLRKSFGHMHDSPELELIADVSRSHEAILPKSAAFSHYPKWFSVFQSATPFKKGFPSTCGVLVLSTGDNLKISTTLESIKTQRLPVRDVQISPLNEVGEAIARLVRAGCESFIPIISGDRLPSHAHDHLIALLTNEAAWGYGDCDQDNLKGQRANPWFKPIWDVDLFIGNDIYTQGAIFSISVIEQAKTQISYHFKHDALTWDILIAGIAIATEKNDLRVRHLPKIIYHRQPDSTTERTNTGGSDAREYAMGRLVHALVPGARVQKLPDQPELLRAIWPLPKNLPRVSVIIPTRDQFKILQACVEGVLTKTDYPNIELIIVDNDSTDLQTLAYLDELRTRGVTVLRHPFPFNYPAVNNRAAEIANGDLICLLNNDIEIIDCSWLTEMVSNILRPRIGIVGAKLVWPNGMVQHGGVVVGINCVAAHVGNSTNDLDAAYLYLNLLAHRRSSVTGACLLLERKTYLDHGGMDENLFPVAFNDVDLCLRIVSSGKICLYTPFAKLIHAESASRGKDRSPDRVMRAQRERINFIGEWNTIGLCDPYYSPNLSHDYSTGAYGGLGLPPRDQSMRSNYDHYRLSRERLAALNGMGFKTSPDS